MRNFTHRCPNSGHLFPNLGQFFPIFEKGQGKPPPLLPPSSYAPALFVCESAMVPGVCILLFSGRKGTLFFLHIQLHNYQKDLNPRLWLYYCDKVIVELEKKNKQQKHKLFIVLVVWPSSTLKLLFDFDFK